VRAHGRLATLRSGEKALSWLLGIARNVFYEELRRRRRHLRSIDANDEKNESSELAASSPSPEGVLMGAEADAQLEAALRELGDDRRVALIMRIDHELEYEEIAAAMNWPLSKVKNEIHRARLTLRTRLRSYVGGP
jgi:RNA polymerase sigma-70 factor (ECF subfamily)